MLAGDAKNAPLVLALAPAGSGQGKPADWQGHLVRSMVDARDYAGAEAVWSRISGVARRGLLYNPQFRDHAGPPPFNWQLSSGTSGVAEASGAGGLDVIYYGREEVSLASQLVRLPPGRYRLAMRVDAPTGAAGLEWWMTCAVSNSALMKIPLDSAQKGMLVGDFAVPAADCPAQWLELRGRPVDSPGSAQLTISSIVLAPLGMAP